ncbi:MAG TPA: restriction endonuclease subunit S [Verrucomicrobiae bacterium]|nr:restriction endonuclease subunit S [Verrucomicrobiae bacterium]
MKEVRSERRTEPTDRGMSDWQKTTVGEIASGFLSGGTPSTSRADFWEGEIPWITSKWLGDKLELITGEKFVSEEAVKKTATKIVPKGSIIFATRVGVGKVGINRIDLAINQDLAGVLIDNERYDIKFLAYQLGIDSIQQYVAMNKRGATIKGITRDCLEQIRLNLPPLPEQKKIARILSTVQRAIESQERIIQTTTELKKALMHKLFTEGLRKEPQKQTEIGPVPESWEVVGLGEVAKIERGKFSHRPRNEPRFYGGEYPFVQTGDVSNCDGYVRNYTQTLNEDGLAISKMFPAGTILITIAANIGFTGILKFNSACPDSLIGITPNENLHTEFLNYYLITQQSEMDRLAPKGTQKNINIQFLKPWPVPLPSFEEQTDIAEAFSTTDRKIRLATQKRNEFQDLFRTLLHELMTAKTRVANINLANATCNYFEDLSTP